MVPGARARPGRRALQHRRLGRLDAGAAAGGLGDPQLQLADGLRDHRRARARLGRALAALLSTSPDRHRAARAPRSASYIAAGQEQHLARRRPRPSPRQILAPAQLLGHRPAALPGRSDLGHADLLGAALPEPGARHFDLKQIALFAWMPFLAADVGCIVRAARSALFLQRRGVSLINARRWAFTARRGADDGRWASSGVVESPYAAIALLSLGGFAHQTLSVTVITMSSDLFRRSEVATVAGMAGTCGNAGAADLLADDRRPGGHGRLHAVLRRPRRARPRRRGRAVDAGARARRPPRSRRMPERAVIRNPILPGFNPDPSIVRVGDDYYIATSTFEWYPGRPDPPLARPGALAPADPAADARASQLDMRGDPDSCGVWAPCLTYADGLFYLIYTDVKRYGRTTVGGASGASLRDFHNYLVTSPTHRRRLVGSRLPQQQRLRSVAVPRRRRPEVPASTCSGTIARAATASPASCCRNTRRRERRLVGERRIIFEGTPLGLTEAPHLYKRDGYYYLITAEGGTGWGHAVTMARSRDADRPLRAAPRRLRPDRARPARCAAAARRPCRPRRDAGRRDLHGLSVRPAAPQPRPLHARPRDRDPADGLGRRRLAAHARTATGLPQLEVAGAGRLPAHPFPAAPSASDFDAPQLPIDFQWLRTP